MIKLITRKNKCECKELRGSIDRRNDIQQQATQQIKEIQQTLQAINK